jgi:hypothetical protein
VLRQKSSGKDYFAGSSIIDYLLGTFYFPGLWLQFGFPIHSHFIKKIHESFS